VAGSDDLFLVVVRFMPMFFVVAGIVVVVWLSQQRLPHELQPDVLAALSDSEALSSHAIRERPPLAHQNVDMGMLENVLNELCVTGLAVRWYEPVASGRTTVYRRIKAELL
jgi:hypothetical protein